VCKECAQERRELIKQMARPLCNEGTAKRCCACKQDKARTEFYRASHTKDGLQYQCKACSRKRAGMPAYREAYNERRRAKKAVQRV
jgi:hypothetical protein